MVHYICNDIRHVPQTVKSPPRTCTVVHSPSSGTAPPALISFERNPQPSQLNAIITISRKCGMSVTHLKTRTAGRHQQRTTHQRQCATGVDRTKLDDVACPHDGVYFDGHAALTRGTARLARGWKREHLLANSKPRAVEEDALDAVISCQTVRQGLHWLR